MSFFSWFSRKSSPAPDNATRPGVLPGHEPTVPMGQLPRAGQAPQETNLQAQANQRKNERMERRELLYTVVRDAMVRAGVLSASYKFKVLSLDQRGSQFLVMMDVAREFGGDPSRLSDIETLIAQTAKSRYSVAVTAVYWRINDQVAAGVPLRVASSPGATHPAAAPTAQWPSASAARSPALNVAMPSRDSGLGRLAADELMSSVASPASPDSAPAPLTPAFARASAGTLGQAPRPLPSTPSAFDPIEADEVAAFRKALGNHAAASNSTARRPAARTGNARQSHTEDFADTEMTGHTAPAPDLGVTQYGNL